MRNLTLILVIVLLLSACGPSPAAIETAIAQTQAAAPTATIAPTSTPAPTNTRKPTATRAARTGARFAFEVGSCRSYTDLRDRDPKDVGCILFSREIVNLGPGQTMEVTTDGMKTHLYCAFYDVTGKLLSAKITRDLVNEVTCYPPVIANTPTIDPNATAAPTADPLKAEKRNGFYLVGVDIAPGVWRSQGTGDSCYWSVTTKTGDIIENHYGMSGGTMYVPANSFQVEVNNCGSWEYLGE